MFLEFRDTETRFGNTGFQNKAIKGMVDRITTDREIEDNYVSRGDYMNFYTSRNVLNRSSVSQFISSSWAFAKNTPSRFVTNIFMFLGNIGTIVAELNEE